MRKNPHFYFEMQNILFLEKNIFKIIGFYWQMMEGREPKIKFNLFY